MPRVSDEAVARWIGEGSRVDPFTRDLCQDLRDERAQKAKDDAEHAALEADYAAAVRAMKPYLDWNDQWDADEEPEIDAASKSRNEHVRLHRACLAILSTDRARAVIKKEGE